jgi:hypothetical protein
MASLLLDELVVRVTADTKKYEKNLLKAKKVTKSASAGMISSVSKLRTAFTTLGFVVGGLGLGRAILKLNASYEKQRRVIAQTNQVIKSTGGAAGITADQIAKLSAELQKVTNFGDEATQSAANLLLTFNKINKNVFPRTLKLVLDLSEAFQQDLKSSAIQLGKALQDPIVGMSALRRVGLTFTEAQKEQVKVFVETNKLAKAQILILRELESQVGGTSKALVDPIKQMQNAVGDAAEKIGEELNPALRDFADVIIDILPTLTEFGKLIAGLIKPVGALAKLFGTTFEKSRNVMRGLKGEFVDTSAAIALFLDLTRDYSHEIDNTIKVTAKRIPSVFEQLKKQSKLTFEAIKHDAIISTQSWANFLTDRIMEGKINFKSLGDFANLIFKDILRKLIEVNLVNPAVNLISGGLNTFFGGLLGGGSSPVKRANGGGLAAGQLGLVGERGPELFVPQTPGTIIPNEKIGGQTVSIVQNMNFSMGVVETVRSEIEKAAPIIANQAKSSVFSSIERGGFESKSVRRRR